MPSGVLDPRGAESYLKVRRAPRGEKTPLGAVHRRPQQEAGGICGLGAGARGFTLVEMVVVVAMIGLLLAISIPNLRRSMVRAELLGNVKVVRQAVAVSRIHAVKNSRRVALKILNDATIEAGPMVVAWVDDDLDEVFDAGEDEVGSWRIDSTIFLGPDVTDGNRSLHVLSGTERGVVLLPTGTAITHLDNIGVGQGAVVVSDYKLNQIRLTIQAGSGTVIEEMLNPGDSTWSIHERFWRY